MPKLLSDSAVIARVHLLMIWRALPIYIVIFTLFPLAFLFFAKYLTPEGFPVGSRLVTGSIVFMLGVSVVNDLSQTLLNERFNHHLKLIIVAPVAKGSYAAGVVAAGLLRGLVSSYVILLFAPLFEVHIELSLWLVPLTMLSAFSLSGIALVIGTWSPNANMGNLLANMVGILVVFFSPIYFPVSRLPDWLQWPARFSPYTHAGTAIDAVLSGSGGFYDEMALLTAITAVALALGVWGMRWRDI